MKRFSMAKWRQWVRDIVRAPVANTALMRNKRPIISFTFDDFPRSAFLNGASILEKYDSRGTFYAAGSFCGKVVDEVVQYSLEDAVALLGAGHELGCHTFSHRRTSTLSENELIKEIHLNKEFVSRHFPGVKLEVFAYPYGDFSMRSTLVLQRKFVACRATKYGFNSRKADLGRLRAVRLYNRTIKRDEISSLVQEAVSQNAWLIFYTHDVDVVPSPYGCTPDLFEYAVMTAAHSGADVLNIGSAMLEISGQPGK